MRKQRNIILTGILIILTLASCLAFSTLGFIGIWLHTYNVFTERKLVAEVSISEIRSDADGEYAVVTYKPVNEQSALTHLLLGQKEEANTGQPQEYKIYGDSVHIGGPIIRFYDNLTLINFKTIYKIGKIYGRYNFDNNKELNRKVISSFDLSGGIDPTWRDINQRTESWPYNMFVDTTQLSTPGKEFTKTAKSYNLYITLNGFLWDLK